MPSYRDGYILVQDAVTRTNIALWVPEMLRDNQLTPKAFTFPLKAISILLLTARTSDSSQNGFKINYHTEGNSKEILTSDITIIVNYFI